MDDFMLYVSIRTRLDANINSFVVLAWLLFVVMDGKIFLSMTRPS
jgi:hypothetical protein